MKMVFNLHSFGSILDELTEVCDVVWDVDDDYLGTRHLLEGTKGGNRFRHLNNVCRKDCVDVLQPRGGGVQAGKLRHSHWVVQLACIPSLLPV